MSKTLKTKSGKTLFPIGIGTWGIAGTFNNNPTQKYNGAEPKYGDESDEIEAIRYSILRGQNYIDCAELYGAFYTDEVVGRAISGTDREDLYIADKLWKTSLEKGLVRPTVEQMLKKLNTSYLDMLYIHAPWADVKWQEAIPQIDDLIDEGLVRDFGVSNFTIADMELTQSVARHPIVANQMNYNVCDREEVSEDFLKYCEKNNIQLIAYRPTGRGSILEIEAIQDVAIARGATPVQVALAWLLAQGALPIPKSVNKKHIDDNIAAVNLQLTDEDIKLLDEVRN